MPTWACGANFPFLSGYIVDPPFTGYSRMRPSSVTAGGDAPSFISQYVITILQFVIGVKRRIGPVFSLVGGMGSGAGMVIGDWGRWVGRRGGAMGAGNRGRFAPGPGARGQGLGLTERTG